MGPYTVSKIIVRYWLWPGAPDVGALKPFSLAVSEGSSGPNPTDADA